MNDRFAPPLPSVPVGTNATLDLDAAEKLLAERKFQLGDRVTKTKGSKWTGRVVGFYSTALTPEGYAVESETEIGSVQIYPAKALEKIPNITGVTEALAQAGNTEADSPHSTPLGETPMNDRFAPPLPSVPGGIQWRDLATAPRDGTIIAVRFYPWNDASSQPSYQVAHWLRGEFRTPLEIDSIAYADAWVPVDELTRVLEEDQVKEGK